MSGRAHSARAGVAAAILMVAGPAQARPGAAAPAAEPAARPTMSMAALKRVRSKDIGGFGDEASAQAALRAAKLPRGTYATAWIREQRVAIAPDGRILDLPLRRLPRRMSGPASRPPSDATERPPR